MASVKDFSVGGTAYIYGCPMMPEGRVELIEARVLNVGRKYVTVKTIVGGHEIKFSEGRTNGKVPFLVEETIYSFKEILFPTKTAADEWIELGQLRKKIERAFQWNKIMDYTLEQLREVAKTIPEEYEC